MPHSTAILTPSRISAAWPWGGRQSRRRLESPGPPPPVPGQPFALVFHAGGVPGLLAIIAHANGIEVRFQPWQIESPIGAVEAIVEPQVGVLADGVNTIVHDFVVSRHRIPPKFLPSAEFGLRRGILLQDGFRLHQVKTEFLGGFDAGVAEAATFIGAAGMNGSVQVWR